MCSITQSLWSSESLPPIQLYVLIKQIIVQLHRPIGWLGEGERGRGDTNRGGSNQQGCEEYCKLRSGVGAQLLCNNSIINLRNYICYYKLLDLIY